MICKYTLGLYNCRTYSAIGYAYVWPSIIQGPDVVELVARLNVVLIKISVILLYGGNVVCSTRPNRIRTVSQTLGLQIVGLPPSNSQQTATGRVTGYVNYLTTRSIESTLSQLTNRLK